jgi:hypothetical protein
LADISWEKNSASSFNPLCMISNQLEFRLKSVFLIVFFIWESGAKRSFPLTLTDDKFSLHKKQNKKLPNEEDFYVSNEI